MDTVALNLFINQILQFSIDGVCNPYVLPNLGVWPVMHRCSHDKCYMEGTLTNNPNCCEVNAHSYGVHS
jgi:hypothetical protein